MTVWLNSPIMIEGVDENMTAATESNGFTTSLLYYFTTLPLHY